MEKFGEWKHKYCISDLDKGGNVTWTVDVKNPGVYQVNLEVRGDGRYVWNLETDEPVVLQNQQGASSIFTESAIGWLRIDRAGKHEITVRLLDGCSADLSAISFIPLRF